MGNVFTRLDSIGNVFTSLTKFFHDCGYLYIVYAC